MFDLNNRNVKQMLTFEVWSWDSHSERNPIMVGTWRAIAGNYAFTDNNIVGYKESLYPKFRNEVYTLHTHPF